MIVYFYYMHMYTFSALREWIWLSQEVVIFTKKKLVFGASPRLRQEDLLKTFLVIRVYP